MMKKILLLFLLMLSIPLVSAASVNVSVTENKQLAFSLENDVDGSVLTTINIYNEKSKMIYEFEKNITYSQEPSFKMINCRDCKSGTYLVTTMIGDESLQTSFDIPKESFDLFWIIAIILIISLCFFAWYFLRYDKNSKLTKTISNKSKTKKK